MARYSLCVLTVACGIQPQAAGMESSILLQASWDVSMPPAPCGHTIWDHVHGIDNVLWCSECGVGALACVHCPEMIKNICTPVSGPIGGSLLEWRFIWRLMTYWDELQLQTGQTGNSVYSYIDPPIRAKCLQKLKEYITWKRSRLDTAAFDDQLKCVNQLLVSHRHVIDVGRRPQQQGTTGTTSRAAESGHLGHPLNRAPPDHPRPNLPPLECLPSTRSPPLNRPPVNRSPLEHTPLDRPPVNRSPLEYAPLERPPPPANQTQMSTQVKASDSQLAEEQARVLSSPQPPVAVAKEAILRKRKRTSDPGEKWNGTSASSANGRPTSASNAGASGSSPTSPHVQSNHYSENVASGSEDAYSSDDSLIEKSAVKIDRAFERVPKARLIAVYTELAHYHRKQATDVLREACLRDGILAEWIIQRLNKPSAPRASTGPTSKKQHIEENEADGETAEDLLARFAQPAKPALQSPIVSETIRPSGSDGSVAESRPGKLLPCAPYHQKHQTWPPGRKGQCKYHPGDIIWSSTLAHPTAWESPNNPESMVKKRPDKVTWTCCKQTGYSEGCRSCQHSGDPGEVGMSSTKIPYRDVSEPTSRTTGQRRLSNGRFGATVTALKSPRNSTPPAFTDLAHQNNTPRTTGASNSPAPAKATKHTTNHAPSNIPFTNSPLGQMTTAAFLARIEAMEQRNDDVNAASDPFATYPPTEKPYVALKSSKPAKVTSATNDHSEERWAAFPPYARGSDSRHASARAIAAGPHWRYTPQNGCQKCARKGLDCLWSSEREKCACCCSQNISKQGCALGWVRGEGYHVPRNDELTLLLG